MRYLLDANVFIEAKNRYYAFDICPGFWDWMDHVVTGDVGTVTKVLDEIAEGTDELATWANGHKSGNLYLEISDTATQQRLSEITAAVQAGDYKPAAKAKFLAGADPWLIAKAKVLGATVVTHEVPAPLSKIRVPIPNICDAFGVAYANTFDTLRVYSAAFVLKA
ncbi:MAG: DUF4411 family protein [Gemmatimonas sp.]